MRRRNKRVYFLICVLLNCLLYGCGKQSEVEYVFPEIPAIMSDNLEEQVWLKVEGGMWDSLLLYSISDQKIIERYNFECRIWDFAITESSIYFLNGGELWKMNRKTMEQESTEIRRVYRLAAHDGYIFYGDKSDIFVFPEGEDPQVGAVSLQEQFSQPDAQSYKKDNVSMWPPIGDRQETVFGEWRISRIYWGEKNYRIWDIKEEESGEIIMGPEDSNYFYSGDLPDYTRSYTVWGDDEWITFVGSGIRYGSRDKEPIIYQRDGEPEERPIQCLTERKYKYSRIGKDFTLEDGKLFGSITVCLGAKPFSFLRGSADEADYDELFELDIEADTSRVLYSTKKDQAQIVGYKSGKVYCFLDGRIYRESLTDGTREWMLDLREGEWSQYWDEHYSNRDTVSVYWQGDYMIIYMCGGIKSYYIPD